MIVIDDRCDCRLFVPKIDRCKQSACNIYQLILHHKATRKLFLFKVRDYAPCNPIYFHFLISFPECMEYGEYDMFLVSGDIWKIEEIDTVFPKKTTLSYTTDKDPVVINDSLIISNGCILMTSAVKRVIGDHFGAIETDKGYLVANAKAADKRYKGEITQTGQIEIIQTDLLKFYVGSLCQSAEPHELRNQTHTEYKR